MILHCLKRLGALKPGCISTYQGLWNIQIIVEIIVPKFVECCNFTDCAKPQFPKQFGSEICHCGFIIFWSYGHRSWRLKSLPSCLHTCTAQAQNTIYHAAKSIKTRTLYLLYTFLHFNIIAVAFDLSE